MRWAQDTYLQVLHAPRDRVPLDLTFFKAVAASVIEVIELLLLARLFDVGAAVKEEIERKVTADFAFSDLGNTEGKSSEPQTIMGTSRCL